MRILQQSAPFSHCLFPNVPLLAAPRIAGLLAAPIPQAPPPKVEPFTYADPRLNDLSETQREKLYAAAKTLFDTAVAFSLDDMNLHALQTALVIFRRALTDQPVKPRNPAEFNAERDAPIVEWLVEYQSRRAEREAQIARDIDILWNGTVRHD
jgi:hypothetical protein